MIPSLLDNLVAQINAKSDWSQTFTADRRAVPYSDDISKLVKPGVYVAPGLLASSIAARSVVSSDMTAEIGVFKKVTSDANSDVDPWVDLATEVWRWSHGVNLSDGTSSGKWVGSQLSVISSVDHLYEMGVYGGLITCTYRLHTGF